MQTRIATVLSIAGVLVAGSAAALANTNILSAEQTSGASSAVLPPIESVDLTVPPVPTTTTTLPPSTTTTVGPTGSPAAAPAPATPSPAAAPAVAESFTSDFLTTFNVGAAGSVTVDVISGEVRIVEAVPGDGYRLSDTEEHDATARVEFRSATVAVVLEATFDGQKIVPTVSSYSLMQPATATQTASAGAIQISSASHEDDDHESDDHESDDHESDDHGESESEYESEQEPEHHESESESHEEDERDDD